MYSVSEWREIRKHHFHIDLRIVCGVLFLFHKTFMPKKKTDRKLFSLPKFTT